MTRGCRVSPEKAGTELGRVVQAWVQPLAWKQSCSWIVSRKAVRRVLLSSPHGRCHVSSSRPVQARRAAVTMPLALPVWLKMARAYSWAGGKDIAWESCPCV